MDLRGLTRRTLAKLAVGTLLLTAGTVARMGRAMRGAAGQSAGKTRGAKLRLLVVGNFFNTNWTRSHLFPLARAANVSGVTVVSSEAGPAYPGLAYQVPPAVLARLVGRAAAKVMWFFVVARRQRPDVAIGYHIMPNGLLCLGASGLLGCRGIYQMTGGPEQFIGGGYQSENPLLAMQGSPSAVLEGWMFGAGRLMDDIIVRGHKARRFLSANRVTDRAAIITGSVDCERFRPGQCDKPIDIAYVARLVPGKGLELFVEVLGELARCRGGLRAVIAGQGVLGESLRRRVAELGVQSNVTFLGRTDDVPGVLGRSRLFMLVSPHEGLSIAMLEAMGAGLPVVVSDVGELAEALAGSGAGVVLGDLAPAAVARVALELLDDPGRLAAMGAAARARAVQAYSLPAVARQWEALLGGTGFQPVADSSHRLKACATKLMKQALSKKNLWENSPAWLKAAVTPLVQSIPTAWWLGRSFRAARAFVAQAERWPAQRARQYQLQRLGQVVRLAYEKSPFYRRTFGAVGFEPGDLKSLADLGGLPLIDKRTVVEHLEEMCVRDPRGPDVDFVSTSGTSGLPVRFYIQAGRSAVEYAYTVSCWQRAGYRLGMPMAVLRGQVVRGRRGDMHYEYDPILRQHRYSNFHTSPADLERYAAHLASLGPCVLMAYPSAAAMLARFIERRGNAPRNVRAALLGSENIYPDDRQLIERVFGCRVLADYGHTEKLVLAAECERDTRYHVWPTYGYCELLDEQDRPVSRVGQYGQIVGTGFLNTVVPLIRYRTGDWARYAGDCCQACGREHMLLDGMEGRRREATLRARDGSAITTTAMVLHDETFNDVDDYQFHQSTPGAAQLWVVAPRGLSEHARRRLLAGVNAKLQGQVRVELRLVEAVHITPRGKKPRIVSTLKDEGEAGDGNTRQGG